MVNPSLSSIQVGIVAVGTHPLPPLLALAPAHDSWTVDSPVTNLNGMVTRSSSDILAVFFRSMKLSWVLDLSLEGVYGSDEVDEEQAGTHRALTGSWQTELLLKLPLLHSYHDTSPEPTPLSPLL